MNTQKDFNLQTPDPAKDILKFPCDFPLKIIGKNENNFEQYAFQFVREFVPELPFEALKSRPSSSGTYLSVTMTFTARSRAQVDSIYQAMADHKRILFAL